MSVLRASIEPLSLDDWPSLPLESWTATYDTLHMWMEVVGKVQLALTPKVNHWWNVTLYVTARGLASQSMRYGDRLFDIEFDFISHQLAIQMDDGRTRLLELTARPVADFYKEFVGSLHSLGIEVKIWPMPVEFPNPIRFDQDLTHASYDPEFAHRFWRILVSVDAVLKEFRAGFIGKCSPVHFFWGSFDLCVTRFSGRRAPEREGADPVTREAYSHEVISAGFWPGSGNIAGPAFYAYAAPQPKGFDQFSVRPAAAFYDRELGEFILMYDEVRTAPSPRAALLEFLQSTYEAGANLAGWERKALEK
ncbi:MAG TPA: DUF5996 family protein [Terriglobales bacterium]